jgi:hypothetical protein
LVVVIFLGLKLILNDSLASGVLLCALLFLQSGSLIVAFVDDNWPWHKIGFG